MPYAHKYANAVMIGIAGNFEAYIREFLGTNVKRDAAIIVKDYIHNGIVD